MVEPYWQRNNRCTSYKLPSHVVKLSLPCEQNAGKVHCLLHRQLGERSCQHCRIGTTGSGSGDRGCLNMNATLIGEHLMLSYESNDE